MVGRDRQMGVDSLTPIFDCEGFFMGNAKLLGLYAVELI